MKTVRRQLILAHGFLGLALIGLVPWLGAGCGSESNPAATSPASSDGAPPAAPLAPVKVKFKDESGRVLFSLKPKEDGAKLVDADEKELARYTLSQEKIKIKTAQDNVIGYVTGTGGRFKLTTSDQNQILFKLQRQDDGDWKLEDGSDGLIYKIKKRDYGFEIEDPHDQSLAKIKLKDSKSSLRDARDQTRFYTNDPIQLHALACLGFDQLEDIRLRAALLFALNRNTPPQ